MISCHALIETDACTIALVNTIVFDRDDICVFFFVNRSLYEMIESHSGSRSETIKILSYIFSDICA